MLEKKTKKKRDYYTVTIKITTTSPLLVQHFTSFTTAITISKALPPAITASITITLTLLHNFKHYDLTSDT
ncbi:hypothetical protein E2C01_062697 [Portunus trituberculatus]|uniref:Uncharacterized protein n=1 Tax=Portunus trituberculatus TaxID=210409 RepID=A0A5B7HFZ2_PORTR|nr:hypothetical protein [Portunus trituberculatus]